MLPESVWGRGATVVRGEDSFTLLFSFTTNFADYVFKYSDYQLPITPSSIPVYLSCFHLYKYSSLFRSEYFVSVAICYIHCRCYTCLISYSTVSLYMILRC